MRALSLRLRGIGIPGLLMLLVVLLCAALVVYPVVFIVAESLNVGEPGVFPPEAISLANYAGMRRDLDVLVNTLLVAFGATVMAVVIGFVLAWILTRTNIPGHGRLERLMELPYYMTPLVGAMAWAVLAAPKNGLLNQLWHVLGGGGDLFNIYAPLGIAWVMALFEGTVAFVMISAAMKSMDPSLEESSRVFGAGKLRTALRITLPLVAPGVLSATVFVFAEMLGAFAAAFVLGIPGRYYVVTTAIWESTQSFPPEYGRAAALGLSLFVAMVVTLTISKLIMRRGAYATITGKAFRPRPVDVGRARWLLVAVAWFYILVAVILPLAALLLTSFQKFATVDLSESIFTIANYVTALSTGTLGPAFLNSLILGLSVASIGVPVIGILTWIVYRSDLPGRGLVEYVLMFPQAVPRVVFGLGLLWAWINIPIPIYGTLWLLGIAYFTVFLPLGLRTMAGVVLQVDRSLEECARVCGASWLRQMRTISLPLLRPGLAAAWLLIFIASVRELGASIFLMGPRSKVVSPAIINAWLTSSSELSAAMAVILTATVFAAVVVLFGVARRFTGTQQA
ncbi:ABC transporter permease [Rhodopila sp.]|jgi:iron(III) transport system permease protein|uniref:ABC transporter permease n=1 Tax=Rhodopila sp. TaxID=2480087 RepID=UPI002C1E7E4D|nr:iron ABC transporter permease [Rhodopila sp.]HVZ09519.1 iron ABC transporter permease [Rhodopila sp.]